MNIIEFSYKAARAVSKTLTFIFNIFYLKIMKINIPMDSIRNINGKIFIRNRGTVIIGNNVAINSNYVSNPIGGNCFTSIYVKQGARLTIGDNTGISNTAIVCSREINIGKYVFIGGDCKIYDTDFHSLNFEKRNRLPDNDVRSGAVNIKYGAFIGTGAIILKGVTVGEKSIIGAGSVVACDIPDNEIWAGNPARFIRKNV
jgi:acetyltransferase-like isoleucine patch superfamily enzyme